jgi:hypothetical protein
MPDDSVRAERAPKAFLRKIRGALFEVEQPSAAVHATGTMFAGLEPALEADPAAFAMLRDVVRRELGAAHAEFELQLNALSDALPDEPVRLRVALKVLAGKGIAIESLLAELDAGLHALELTQQSWEGKVAARRGENQRERAEIDSARERARSEAERELERLKASIQEAESALERADTERSERAAALESASAELAQRDANFRAAHAAVRAEHAALIEKLRASLKESVR